MSFSEQQKTSSGTLCQASPIITMMSNAAGGVLAEELLSARLAKTLAIFTTQRRT